MSDCLLVLLGVPGHRVRPRGSRRPGVRLRPLRWWRLRWRRDRPVGHLPTSPRVFGALRRSQRALRGLVDAARCAVPRRDRHERRVVRSGWSRTRWTRSWSGRCRVRWRNRAWRGSRLRLALPVAWARAEGSAAHRAHRTRETWVRWRSTDRARVIGSRRWVRTGRFRSRVRGSRHHLPPPCLPGGLSGCPCLGAGVPAGRFGGRVSFGGGLGGFAMGSPFDHSGRWQ